MSWTKTETLSNTPDALGRKNVVETWSLKDRDGVDVVVVSKDADDAVSMEVGGELVAALDAVSPTELGYLNGVTSAIQTQLDAKQASILRSYLAATVTYNNTNTLADTALSVTVATGGIYRVELVVYSTSAVKALLLDFGGTVTPANFVGEWFATNGGDETELFFRLAASAVGTDFGPTPLDGSGGTLLYTFTGSLEVTTGGTFLLRGAQNAADASDTKILRGSTLILTPMN